MFPKCSYRRGKLSTPKDFKVGSKANGWQIPIPVRGECTADLQDAHMPSQPRRHHLKRSVVKHDGCGQVPSPQGTSCTPPEALGAESWNILFKKKAKRDVGGRPSIRAEPGEDLGT